MSTNSVTGQANSTITQLLSALVQDPGFCVAVDACVANNIVPDKHVFAASVDAGTTTVRLKLTDGAPDVTVDIASAILTGLGTPAGNAAIVAAVAAGLAIGIGIKGTGAAGSPLEFAASELPSNPAPSGVVTYSVATPDGGLTTLAQLGAALTAAGAVSVGLVVENLDGTVDTTLNAVTANSMRVINEQTAASSAPAPTDYFTMLIGGAHVKVTVTQLATALSSILPDVKLVSGTYNAVTKAIDFTLSNGGIVPVPVAALLPVTTVNSVTGDGATVPLSLIGDAATPGNLFYYGTDTAGVKGFYALPVVPATTNTLTASSGSAFTSTVDGVPAVLTPASGVIASTLGFDATGALVKQTPVPTVLDGNHTPFVRVSPTPGVAPSPAEVPAPINGDTASIKLPDGTEEQWIRSGGVWTIAYTNTVGVHGYYASPFTLAAGANIIVHSLNVPSPFAVHVETRNPATGAVVNLRVTARTANNVTLTTVAAQTVEVLITKVVLA